MKLLLVFFTMFFLCLMMGTESGEAPEYEGVNTEVVVHQDQIMVDMSDISAAPNWLKSYLLMLNILDPVKQIDLPGDHDKNWHNLHGKVLRSMRYVGFAFRQKIGHVCEIWRLLSNLYNSGFYIYSLQKLLI